MMKQQRVMKEVYLKALVWGIIGVLFLKANAINIAEHIKANNKPLLIITQIILFILTTLAVKGIYNDYKHNNNTSAERGIKSKNKTNKVKENGITEITFDQLIDCAISIISIIVGILVFMIIVDDNIFNNPLLKLLLVACVIFLGILWCNIFGRAKIAYMAIKEDDQSIMKYFSNSKFGFMKTRKGAAAYIVVIYLLTNGLLIYKIATV